MPNEKHFSHDAKQIVDTMFDTKMLKQDITRDEMNVFEELIEFTLQSRFDSYVKAHALFEKLKDIKK